MSKEKIGSLYVEVETETTKLKNGLKKTESSSKLAGKKAGKSFGTGFSSSLGSMLKFGGITAMFAVIAVAIRKASKTILDLDKGLRNVNTIIRVTDKELKGFGKTIMSIRSTTGKTTEELTDGFYQLVSAGVAAADSMEFLGVAAKAGIAGLTDTKTSVDGLTTVINAWGMSSEDAGEVADKMFKTVELGKTTFGEIAASISMVAPLAAAVGVSFDEVSGAVAQLTSQGTPTSVAMTQIASAINGLNKELGDGWSETRTLQSAMVEMFEKTGGSATKLQEAFGRKEGVLAVLAMAGVNAEKTADKLNKVGDAMGSFGTAFAEQSKSIEFKINRLSVAMDGLSVSLIDNFSNSITWLVENFTGGLDILTGRASDARRQLESIVNEDFITAFEIQYKDSEIDFLIKRLDEIGDKTFPLLSMPRLLSDDEAAKLSRLSAEAEAIRNVMSGTVTAKVNIAVGFDKKTITNEISLIQIEIDKLKSVEIKTDFETTSLDNLKVKLSEAKERLDAVNSDAVKIISKDFKVAVGSVTNLTDKLAELDLQLQGSVAPEAILRLQDEIKETIAQLDEAELKILNLRGDGVSFDNIKPMAPDTTMDDSGTQAEMDAFDEEQETPTPNLDPEKFQEDLGIMESSYNNFWANLADTNTTFSEKLKNGWDLLASSFSQMVGDLVKTWIIGLFTQQVAAKAGEATAIVSAQVTGTAVAAAWATPAALASIATFGAAAATGTAALAAGVGAAQGLIAAHDGGTFENGKKVASFAGGGDFIVPSGYSNDSFPMMVESGERVQVTPSNKVGQTDKLLGDVLGSIQAMNMSMQKNRPQAPSVNLTLDADGFTERQINPAIERLSKAKTKNYEF